MTIPRANSAVSPPLCIYQPATTSRSGFINPAMGPCPSLQVISLPMRKSNTFLSRLGLVIAGGLLAAAASQNFTNDPGVVNNGGGNASSPSFILDGSIGQSAVGISSSPNYIGA